MTFANLLRALALWIIFGAPLLLLAGLWSSAGHAVIDGAAVAYAARWVG